MYRTWRNTWRDYSEIGKEYMNAQNDVKMYMMESIFLSGTWHTSQERWYRRNMAAEGFVKSYN